MFGISLLLYNSKKLQLKTHEVATRPSWVFLNIEDPKVVFGLRSKNEGILIHEEEY